MNATTKLCGQDTVWPQTQVITCSQEVREAALELGLHQGMEA